MNDNLLMNYAKEIHNQYYGRGKLLLSGEYFVLDGAESLALPVTLGQSITIRHSPSFSPALYWKSFDSNDNLWFEAKFEFWHFDCTDEKTGEEVDFLKKILIEARKLNIHFLRDEVDVFVETKLEFPLEWGLGSSSTLIYNIAQWAYVSPFELLFNVYNGSGYDIACAQADHPIIYKKSKNGPGWSKSKFNPTFTDSLYFIYMGRKANSIKAIKFYNETKENYESVVKDLTLITREMEICDSLTYFEKLIVKHENLISKTLNLPRVKEKYFKNFWGEIKSLGAWGGDFIMATSEKGEKETKEYFSSLGYNVFFPYSKLALMEEVKESKAFQQDAIVVQ